MNLKVYDADDWVWIIENDGEENEKCLYSGHQPSWDTVLDVLKIKHDTQFFNGGDDWDDEAGQYAYPDRMDELMTKYGG